MQLILDFVNEDNSTRYIEPFQYAENRGNNYIINGHFVSSDTYYKLIKILEEKEEYVDLDE